MFLGKLFFKLCHIHVQLVGEPQWKCFYLTLSKGRKIDKIDNSIFSWNVVVVFEFGTLKNPRGLHRPLGKNCEKSIKSIDQSFVQSGCHICVQRIG
ncbi:hypothetical protein Y032_0541g3178 [Ancylostoma ceylanicum]|uniref:Uncharacterized protein n=1 Tax=Ancylostoma ceylanicum TaxID=53326 RepID=A0A016WR53_9BILA|nr:hypothetical protein Y032_0541g3178 [Ancylostoma ceylanicum]